MNNELQIYRKRLIPEECILLKDDIIVEQIHTAASDMRFALQLLLDSVDSLEL